MQTTLLFSRVAGTLGLAGLAPNQVNACAFVVDDDTQVELRHDAAADTVSLCVAVFHVPLYQAAAVQRRALAANLRPAELAGAHFALHPDRAELVLCAALEDLQGDASRVCDAVGRLVVLSRHWRAQFSS